MGARCCSRRSGTEQGAGDGEEKSKPRGTWGKHKVNEADKEEAEADYFKIEQGAEFAGECERQISAESSYSKNEDKLYSSALVLKEGLPFVLEANMDARVAQHLAESFGDAMDGPLGFCVNYRATPAVDYVNDNGWAAQEGVKVGDKLLLIDFELTAGIGHAEIAKRLASRAPMALTFVRTDLEDESRRPMLRQIVTAAAMVTKALLENARLAAKLTNAERLEMAAAEKAKEALDELEEGKLEVLQVRDTSRALVAEVSDLKDQLTEAKKLATKSPTQSPGHRARAGPDDSSAFEALGGVGVTNFLESESPFASARLDADGKEVPPKSPALEPRREEDVKEVDDALLKYTDNPLTEMLKRTNQDLKDAEVKQYRLHEEIKRLKEELDSQNVLQQMQVPERVKEKESCISRSCT